MFPGDANQRNAGINDLPGLVIRSIAFGGTLTDATTYDLLGNSIVLRGGVVVDLPNTFFGNHQIDLSVDLQPTTGNQSVWDIRRGSTLATGVNNNARLSGSAGVLKIGDGELSLSANTYTGVTTVRAGTLRVNGTQESGRFVVESGLLRLSFRTDLGPIDVGAASLFLEPWRMKSETVQLDPTSTMIVQSGTSSEPDLPCGELTVTGAVSLNNSAFQIDQFSRLTPLGTSCVVVSNDGSDAVNGQFAGLAEGGVISAGIRSADGAGFATASYKISYVGGDGNDITLTRV